MRVCGRVLVEGHVKSYGKAVKHRRSVHSASIVSSPKRLLLSLMFAPSRDTAIDEIPWDSTPNAGHRALTKVHASLCRVGLRGTLAVYSAAFPGEHDQRSSAEHA